MACTFITCRGGRGARPVAATNASEPSGRTCEAAGGVDGEASAGGRRHPIRRQTAPHNDESRRGLRRFESAAAVDHSGDVGSSSLFVPSGGVRRLQSSTHSPPRAARRALRRPLGPAEPSPATRAHGPGQRPQRWTQWLASYRRRSAPEGGGVRARHRSAGRPCPAWEPSPVARGPAACAGRAHCRARCLIRAVSSWTCSKVLRRCAISLRIFLSACMTVVWSRPPNVWPMRGSERSVSSRHRYMAI
jgi:hypothetical protein